MSADSFRRRPSVSEQAEFATLPLVETTPDLLDRQPPTVGEVITAFSLSPYFKDLSPATQEAYRVDYNGLSQFFQDRNVDGIREIKPEHFAEYIQECSERFLPSTVMRKRGSLGSLVGWMAGEGMIDSIELPKAPKVERNRQSLSLEEERTLFEAAKDNLEDTALIAIILQTGANSSQVARLRASDLSQTPERTVVVRIERGEWHVLRELDNEASSRVCAYLEEVSGANSLLFSPHRSSQNPLTRQAIWVRLAKYGERVGRPISPRLLKETYHQRYAKKALFARLDLPFALKMDF